MEKILIKSMGGYCFELNGLFLLFLRSLGFEAWMCQSRQLRHDESYPVPATHCGIIVNLDRKLLFCDVGYGGPIPIGSMELKPGVIQLIGNEKFYFDRQKSDSINYSRELNVEWITLIWIHKNKSIKLMQIVPVKYYLMDFYGQNLLRSSGDSAYVTHHANIFTKDGAFDLTGNIFSKYINNEKKEYNIPLSNYNDILKKYFGIIK